MRPLLSILLLSFFSFVTYSSAQSPFEDAVCLVDSTYQSDTIPGIQELVIYNANHGYAHTVDVNNSSFYLEYQPDPDFVGQDTISVEYHDGGGLHYHHWVIEVLESIIHCEDDLIIVDKNSDYIYADPLSNDFCTACPLRISGINLKENTYSYLSNDSLYLKPTNGFSGLANINYSICDTLDHCTSKSLGVLVIDTSVLVSDTTLQLQMAENTSKDIYLDNDQYGINSDAQNGTVEFIHYDYALRYTPFQNFYGRDTIVLSDSSSTRTIIINVLELPDPNMFVVDDYVYLHPNSEVVFDVLENDIVANSGINYFSDPSSGTLTKLSGGEFQYVPDVDFSGTVEFEYIVCLPLGGPCETGTVTLYVNSLDPDKTVQYKLTTPKNKPFVINYDVPITNFDFQVSMPPVNGELDIYPGFDTLQIGCEDVNGYNLVVYTPDSNFVGLDTFDLKYCVDGNCTMFAVTMEVIDKGQDTVCACVDNCVWPGDLNDDGLVNMKDLLSLSYNLGHAGTQRPEASGDWMGQYCPDWGSRYNAYDIDEKHLDADGNGAIETADSSYISMYFNQNNRVLPPPVRFKQPFPVTLEYVGPPNPEIGDLVSFELIIGNEEYPALMLDGFTFGISVNPNTVDTSSLTAYVHRNSFLTAGNASLDMQHKEGRNFDLGIGRTDREIVSGYGRIATIDFIIEDDIDGIHAGTELPIVLDIRNLSYRDINGAIFDIPNFTEKLYISMGDDERRNFSELRVHPNPTEAGAKVHAALIGKGTIENLHVVDLNGTVITQKQFSTESRTVSFELPTVRKSGIYFLHFRTSEGVFTEKLIIE